MLAISGLLATAGAAIGQVTPGAFTPDACDDYESYPGARTPITSLFSGTVPVVPGSVTHNSVDAGDWIDFRGGLPIVPCSGSKFGVGFGFGGFTLDFTGIGGITCFSGCASAAGIGSDTIEFFDLAGSPMTGTYTDPDGFGPGDGTMERFSFVSTVAIGSIRLSGAETAYDDLCIATHPTGPTDAATLSIRCGLCDCFALPEDPSTPRPELVSFAASINPNPGPANYDGTVRNRWFAQSFVALPKGCILGGTLTITVRPLPGDASNDSFWIGQVDGPTTSLATHFTGRRYGDASGGAQPVLFPGQPWTSAARPDPCGYTVVIDLNTPVAGGSTLVARMNALGVLDVFSEDDTAFDCMVLDLQLRPGCDPCPPRPCPADFNGDGQLDIFDFLAFQNAFVAGCP
jgi:hypothetical protein